MPALKFHGCPVYSNTKRLFLIFAFAFSLTTVGEELQNQNCDYWLGTFNALKLIHDKKFLPDETAEQKKLELTSQLISALNNAKGPDLLAMVEVDELFLKRLVEHPNMQHLNILNHGASKQSDDRGNNLGLISRFPLAAQPITHIYWDEKDPIWSDRKGFGREPFKDGLLTRPIMEYHLTLPNGEVLIVFVNHWPSKKLGDWSALQRMQAATYLKGITDRIFKDNQDANIILLGDFNTNPYGPEVKVGLGLNRKIKSPLVHLEHMHFDLKNEVKEFKKNNPEAKGDAVNAYAKELLKARGSYYYQRGDEWELFDQVIISRNVLKYLVKDSYGRVVDPRFVTSVGVPRSFSHKKGTGASDHFPVGIRLQF